MERLLLLWWSGLESTQLPESLVHLGEFPTDGTTTPRIGASLSDLLILPCWTYLLSGEMISFSADVPSVPLDDIRPYVVGNENPRKAELLACSRQHNGQRPPY
ncbi:hypothetical protein P168DRAFT_182572 [Aspergillus campestris IBT 28561]|uniref:Uncharacterized protein n=1 Tax=Aspergillus campestris (strain IBT 28561) TaxID=1392248 RepID=A0A2I1D0I8_ASPC2|nr:uncharacterized protein P168DRAFT_182572 [Aspergillus campestris IBT 28561]PKY03390.1 hypothetical protein P168DRAFT_182572 [Aspergillus campestris IBT 28561]